MPNWCDLGKDCPSTEDVYEMESQQAKRDHQYAREQSKVDKYLLSHPSASYVEAQYKADKREWISATPTKTCNRCGKQELVWKETSVGWRLFDKQTKTQHVCEISLDI